MHQSIGLPLVGVFALLVGGCGDSQSSTADTVSPDTVSPDTVSPDTVSPDTVAPDTVETLDASAELADGNEADVADIGSDTAEPSVGVESQGWTVSAPTPVLVNGKVQGAITFTRESGAETRGGGVCLVADLLDSACTSLADCALISPPPEGGFHYCAASKGTSEKRCWTRPGPGDLYCNRSQTRVPDTYLTPEVPPLAKRAPTTWMGYACMAVESTPGGCGTGDPALSVTTTSDTLLVTDVPASTTKLYGVDGNMGDYLGEQFSAPGSLSAMCGTAPGSLPSSELEARLLALDPELPDVIFAAETYDAVIIAALAAQRARDTSGAAVAVQLAAVTTGGETCNTVAACLPLVAAGVDVDYDGQSGPIEFDDNGELAVANFIFLRFGADNRIDESAVRNFLVGDASRASAQTPPAPAQDTPAIGGPLRIGTLLPQTGSLASLGPGTLAAARLAVQDINEAGGVNGHPVELDEGDSGDFEVNLAPDTVQRFIDDGVQVIIGSVSSWSSLSVIEQVIAAGVAMISPANTSDVFTTYADQGLYFRTAAPDKMQGRALAELIVADAHQVVGILARDDDYGVNLGTSLAEELVALGLQVSEIKTLTYTDETDFYGEVLAMQWLQPDAIAILGFDETADLIKALEAVGLGPAR